jgi:hypothetical protein
MDPDVADLARRAAARLSDRFGARLPAQVEARLHGGTAGGTYFNLDPTVISLASLVITCAKFVWDICKDTVKKTPPNPELLERRIRLEVVAPADITKAQLDAIAKAVVAELAPLLTKTKPEPRDGEPPDR